MTHDELENAVLNMLLRKDGDLFSALHKQLDAAKVVSREFSGYGFLTEFSVPDNLKIDTINGRIMDVCGMFADNPSEIYIFILLIVNGSIDSLEGSSFFEWSMDYSKMNLVYANDNEREYDLVAGNGIHIGHFEGVKIPSFSIEQIKQLESLPNFSGYTLEEIKLLKDILAGKQ